MSIRIKRRWVLAISCLIISGCTEKTIIREVPVSSEPEASVPDTVQPGNNDTLTPSVGGGSNMVTDETDTGTGTGTTVDTDSADGAETDTGQLEDPQTPGETDDNSAENPQLEDPIDSTVEGEPGAGVDCDNTLPCRWTSGDSQFSVTVTSADNIGSNNRLQLDYSIDTVHDTQISVAGGGQALDDAGIRFLPIKQTLGSGIAGSPQTLLAGSSEYASIVFGQATASSTLTEWSVSILDGGVARLPSFSNIPVGPVTLAYADCELVLPCIWMTPQGDVSITLTSAGGYTTNNRLSATFAIQSATTISVALDAGAIAVSAEGTNFTGRTHSLGTSQGYKKITAEAYAGYNLTGSIEFYRTTTQPTVLNEVSLILYQDSPVPRWNPKFVNVPVQ